MWVQYNIKNIRWKVYSSIHQTVPTCKPCPEEINAVQEDTYDTDPRINSRLFKQTRKRKHIIQLLCHLQQGSNFEVTLIKEETMSKD